MSTNRGMDKDDVVCIYTHVHMYTHTHTMEHYPVMKNEIIPFAVTWMGLMLVILNEVR